MPSGGAVTIIASNGGLRFMEHMAQSTELIGTDGSYAAAEAWCDAHADLVAEGYGFSKECAIVYTMVRALDVVGDGIRINCISPGTTDTPMLPEFKKSVPAGIIEAFYGPMARPATPDEMGWPLVFLNSDAASFLTGQNLIIDGGFVAGMMTGAIDLDALMAKAGEMMGS
jgi:NAD(P)-dependent dehydrogenase (short-subunit alcohol dehydrogenase family)